MKLLFVTNYYPPSEHGWGYTQICQMVADGLAARNHEIEILTSTYGKDDSARLFPYPVHHKLHIDPDWRSPYAAARQFFIGRRKREELAIECLENSIAKFKPDIVFIWHAIGLPRSLLHMAEQVPGTTTVYYLAGYLPELPDEYIAYWEAPPIHPLAKVLKRPLANVAMGILRREGKPLTLKYEHVICVSDHVRRRLVSQGLISESAIVIHNAIDTTLFKPRNAETRRETSAYLNCLIAGRVAPEKGVHTVIEAFGLLKARTDRARLTVLGDGPTGYLEDLKARVRSLQLESIVRFQSSVPHSQMPVEFDRCDVLILASEYEEPLACSMLEAMASGLLVIGTTTGGSGEALAHEQTGLVFEAGNADSLAQQLERVLDNLEQSRCLALRGQEYVRTDFDIRQMVLRIEEYLLQQCQKNHSPKVSRR